MIENIDEVKGATPAFMKAMKEYKKEMKKKVKKFIANVIYFYH